MARGSLCRKRVARAMAPALATAALGLASVPAEDAAAARYWEMACQGPAQDLRFEAGEIRFGARAGRRPGMPARGECVWMDRGVDRPGESRGGRITVRVPTDGRTPTVRMRGGRVRVEFNHALADRVWNAAANGGRFTILVRNVGGGTYLATTAPVAVPAPSRGSARGPSGPRRAESGGSVTVRPAPPRLDCTPIDVGSLRVATIPHRRRPHDRWVLESDSDLPVYVIRGRYGDTFEFMHDRRRAERALRILRHHRPDRVCYVGRPKASMTYFLRGGRPVAGSAPGEVCKPPFDPASLRVARRGGKWFLLSGRASVLVFPNEREAREALAVIRHFGLRRECGEHFPRPGMHYFRR